jgi:hypothetical protein
MVECTWKFEDWHIAADLLHYHECDEEITHINTKIHQLQLDSAATQLVLLWLELVIFEKS